jgi:small-conductance mechanosensitive channel
MKLDKFYKLKNELEIFSFENNFSSLSKTLYYFSFLGNIFLILFSYFFIKNVTNSIPALFTGQGLFFSVFIVLFMTGYELFKRFAFEQLTSTILRTRKASFNVIIGAITCLTLVAGSFYLSLNGAHRLIDTSEIIVNKSDSTLSNKADSIGKYYDKEILYYRNQSARTRSDKKYRDSIVNVLQVAKDAKIKEAEQKVEFKTKSQSTKVEENSLAFAIMVFFLELIILIGVAFNAYYIWTSYDEMKNLLSTPKYKQIETNVRLLKLFYQNGRKKEQDPILAVTKLTALAKTNKIGITLGEIKTFIILCQELEIVTGTRRKKVYNVSYEKAKQLIETQEI